MTRHSRFQQAFSLIEIIIVVVLLGIMATGASQFILKPIEAYVDMERRQELVDSTEMAFRRISRDIHHALPNSLRVTTNGANSILEIINTVDGARYRDEQGGTHVGAGDRLRFGNGGDSSFNILGKFRTIDASAGTVTLPADNRIVIYNTSANVYNAAASNAATNIITPSTTTITVSDDAPDEHQIALDANHRFQFNSPTQRLFLVDGTIVYICNGTAGTLTRYEGDKYTANQANLDSDAELTANPGAYISDLVTQNINQCNFTYNAGTNARSALVTLNMGISKDGESVNLYHEVHIINAP